MFSSLLYCVKKSVVVFSKTDWSVISLSPRRITNQIQIQQNIMEISFFGKVLKNWIKYRSLIFVTFPLTPIPPALWIGLTNHDFFKIWHNIFNTFLFRWSLSNLTNVQILCRMEFHFQFPLKIRNTIFWHLDGKLFSLKAL